MMRRTISDGALIAKRHTKSRGTGGFYCSREAMWHEEQDMMMKRI
jgi:hypothetical protein